MGVCAGLECETLLGPARAAVTNTFRACVCMLVRAYVCVCLSTCVPWVAFLGLLTVLCCVAESVSLLLSRDVSRFEVLASANRAGCLFRTI